MAKPIIAATETLRFLSPLAFVQNIRTANIPITSTTIALTASIPTLPPPPFVAKLLGESCQTTDSQISFYSSRSSFGIPLLQKATLQHYRQSGIDTTNQKCIFTHSEHDLVSMLAKKMTKESKSAIMTLPTFGLFFNTLQRLNTRVTLAKLTRQTNWKLTPKILQNILASFEDAGLFFFTNPGNPMGEVFSKQELELLSQEFLEDNYKRKKDGRNPLMVLSDEASRRIIIDPNTEFCSLASIPGMEEFTITSSTSSKDLAPGLAISHAIGPEAIITQLLDMEQGGELPDTLIADRYGPSYPSQYVLAKTFDLYQKEFDQHTKEASIIYRNKISMVEEMVANINAALEEKFGKNPTGEKFIEFAIRPQGGLQCLIKASGINGLEFPSHYKHAPNLSQRTIESSVDLTYYFQETAGVRILPGELCGFDGDEMMFRITISKDDAVLQKAFAEIARSLGDLLPSQKQKESAIPSTTLAPTKVIIEEAACGRS